MIKLLGIVCFFAVCNAKHVGHLIVGGDEAEVGQFPWQASLQSSSGSHICGGSLVTSTWILTAAHCVGSSPSSYQIVLGLHDQTNNQIGSPETYNVNQIVIHPDYIGSGELGFPNDLALMRLTDSANIGNPYIALVDMVSWGDTFEGQGAIISGWGRLVGNGQPADTLQFASTQVIGNSECASRTNPNWINPGQICVYTGNNGACNGDSGGPLVVDFGGTTYVAGIASWVIGACDLDYPSAYTRVSSYYSWIVSIINS